MVDQCVNLICTNPRHSICIRRIQQPLAPHPTTRRKKVLLNELLLCYFDWYAIVSNQIILANWMLGERRKGKNERMVERRNSVAKNME